jgi:hypothetical protein
MTIVRNVKEIFIPKRLELRPTSAKRVRLGGIRAVLDLKNVNPVEIFYCNPPMEKLVKSMLVWHRF